MNWKNDITNKLHINYPIIQAPMFGVTTPQMVAAATKAGCLGSLPLGDLPVAKCREIIQTTKQLSNGSFAVNLFANEVPARTNDLKASYAKSKEFLEQLARQHNLNVTLPDIANLKFTSYREQVEVVLEEEIKIVSFTFGNLDDQTIQRLKEHDVILIGTCTSVNEAKALETSGIDILCVQGWEAGGHRGTFLQQQVPQIGGFALLPQVYDAVELPLIYAGGIYNAKTIQAANVLGAQGFQVGSLLLGSTESALKSFEKERLRRLNETEIVLTRSFSGRYARGIKNTFMEVVENTGHILPYPYQNKLTGELRKAAKACENPDFVSIWCGQSINGYHTGSTMEILNTLIADTEKRIRN